jgi:hypothetical protein
LGRRQAEWWMFAEGGEPVFGLELRAEIGYNGKAKKRKSNLKWMREMENCETMEMGNQKLGINCKYRVYTSTNALSLAYLLVYLCILFVVILGDVIKC